MTHEIPPDPRRLLDTYCDHNTGRLATYQLEVLYSPLMYTDIYVGWCHVLSYQTTWLWLTSQAVVMPLSLWSSLQTCSGIGTCSSPGSILPTNSLL